MVTLQTISIIFFLGLALFVLGRQFGNLILAILGGFTIFTMGVMVLLESLVNLTANLNLVVGVILFGVGAYVFVTASIEQINFGNEGEGEHEW